VPTHVTVSVTAATLLRKLQQRHGPLLFHLSCGCCDGTAPLCFRQNEFRLGSRDVKLGEVEGVPFYTGDDQAKLLTDAELLIDAVESESDSFSIEAADGVRFVLRTLSTHNSCAIEK